MDNSDFQEESTFSQLHRTDTIKAIDKNTVHRICSGQVVLSLGIAVKELIENSIDAGATIINIFLEEFGSELIEVSDNGGGISEENFEALTLKHYTSKIRKFDDLECIETLGFRGEALSSLCALCNLSVLTKHSDAELGTKISFDLNGKIISKSTAARETGTTVTLSNLFSTLPVRRKEFMKNLKREFHKMCQMLHAYCLVSKGIKISCTNSTSKGAKSIVVATDGRHTVRENIINVFGSKQISSLLNVELITPEEQILSEYGIEAMTEEIPFNFEFFISSVTHGFGRSCTDRQFYFINSRPCDPKKLSKIVNEIYRQFNSNQYPFVYFNLFTKSQFIDVNVTPDKRQLFLENEKILLATVKTSLLKLFKCFPMIQQNLDISKMLNKTSNSERGLKRSFTESSVKKGSIFESFKKRCKTEGEITDKRIDFQLHIVSKDNTLKNKSEEQVLNETLDSTIAIACQLSKDKHSEDFPILRENDSESDDEKSFSLEKTVTVDIKGPSTKKSITIDVDLNKIKEELANGKSNQTKQGIQIKFRSTITPETNKIAEEELEKQIVQSDFARMDIIGQFNLGFIITKLNNDLFIIDQHATDEIYNFTLLQKNTVIDSQVLVHPKPLELSAGNENLLIDNIEIFKKNGFGFKIEPEAPCTKKVFLTAIPISKQFVFGKDDIDELLFMIQDSDRTMCRPTRVRAMFASRACRKSVMIGKPLSKPEMRKLVDHMGEIDQPWNCPHGRPTMRHLINIDLIEDC